MAGSTLGSRVSGRVCPELQSWCRKSSSDAAGGKGQGSRRPCIWMLPSLTLSGGLLGWGCGGGGGGGDTLWLLALP